MSGLVHDDSASGHGVSHEVHEVHQEEETNFFENGWPWLVIGFGVVAVLCFDVFGQMG